MYWHRSNSPSGNAHANVGVAIQTAVFILAWITLLVLGFGRLLKYESKASQLPEAPQQLDEFREAGKMSLVLALHPHCPCSRATAGELVKIYSRAPEKFALTILLFKPKDEADSWMKSRTLDSLRPLNPRVVIDRDGAEASRFGLATSGQVLLYDHTGKLLFNGGITKSRGHSGDNLGEDKLVAFLNATTDSAAAPVSSTPVFGCSLSN